MRISRIFQWVLAVIIAGLLFKAGEYNDYLANLPPESERPAITVYAPDDMEDAFNHALRVANLHETHKIVMTDDENNANICIGYGKQNDESYQKILFSPFVVAYSTSTECQEKLKEAEVFIPSPYDHDYYEVDFLKIMNEAIGEGKWANLNLEEENELKVFYPSEDSIYWNDFYDFLLVTVNNGEYPKTETEMQKAEKVIEKFLNSEHTEGLTDFYEQVQRTGGFPNSVIYIMPEKDALDICSAQSENTSIYYPINTVYFNYYIKGDKIGEQIIDVLENSKRVGIATYDFYYRLAQERYRSAKYTGLKSTTDYANYERDMYNVAKIAEETETVEDATATDSTNPTETTIPTTE